MNDLIGKPLLEIVSPFAATGLFCHVSNDSDDFGVVFQHEGEIHCKQPIRLPKCSAIDAAVAAISPLKCPDKPIAFVPSGQKGFLKKSCWGGLRIPPASSFRVEAGDGRVHRMLKCLRAYAAGRSIIVEVCGDGSWQFWLIRAQGFSAHATWWKLLRKISSEAAIECEIFPSENTLGMPAPGSWDPHTGRLSCIVFADLTAIFPEPAYSAFDVACLPTSASPAITPNAKS